ncbi:hypothetical protein Hamer_G000093 [Homarus americanus]|uniref:Uncharacterized protein n=2 Tax=Homarus americanus TaxID=6706 RepID=A0A8J5TLF2_HOMAM|nr:hypothetical protein Hamer_G000093 [Homarus americanus]
MEICVVPYDCGLTDINEQLKDWNIRLINTVDQLKMYNNLLFRARGFCSTGRFYIIEDSPDSYVILKQSNVS